jgi:hypothetical protein
MLQRKEQRQQFSIVPTKATKAAAIQNQKK